MKLFYKTFSLFFLFPLILVADWVGSPSLPAIVQEGFFLSDRSMASFRMGLDGAYAYDEKLHFTKKERKQGFGSLEVKGPSIMGLFLMNLKERMEFYLQPGMAQFEAQFKKDEESFSRKSHFGFSGKAGTRVIFIEIKDTTIGADVHYRFSNAYLDDIESDQYSSLLWSLREWQIGIGLSHKIKVFTPYFGVAVRQSKQRIPSMTLTTTKRLHANQKHKKGVYLGLVVSHGSKLLLGIEGHLYNEKTLCGSLQIRL